MRANPSQSKRKFIARQESESLEARSNARGAAAGLASSALRWPRGWTAITRTPRNKSDRVRNESIHARRTLRRRMCEMRRFPRRTTRGTNPAKSEGTRFRNSGRPPNTTMNREHHNQPSVTGTSNRRTPGNPAAAARLCRTARFSPFGFRIHARPGRHPRLAPRGGRGGWTAIRFADLTPHHCPATH